jgi:Raf kinase inhibitor-like YbhB/YbcL family protein
MIKGAALGLLAAGLALGLAAAPAEARSLRVSVDSVKSNGRIPNKYAFCVPAAEGHTKGGPNISPRVAWSKGPKGTQSYAIIVVDTDAPAEHRELMNKEGVALQSSVKRHGFYHWVLVDIPANVTALSEGEDSSERTVHGKPQNGAKVGLRGLNDYTKVTASNEAMKGQYFGYDGPCPPWNDERLHHYHFTVYALSVKTLGLSGAFDAEAALAAMKGKVLAKGSSTGIFTQNPKKGAKLEK